ncbi:hypothetical protein [Neobacillus jeddahensis]|uniref:hypothetical protein n=1 Tax=Neobacillus jeddahensis TaxID=1461580 RepID=UPI00058F84A7|nr:hypothetical protein [Neobacillus jeddahensis]
MVKRCVKGSAAFWRLFLYLSKGAVHNTILLFICMLGDGLIAGSFIVELAAFFAGHDLEL